VYAQLERLEAERQQQGHDESDQTPENELHIDLRFPGMLVFYTAR
jgi:hypothetical protein